MPVIHHNPDDGTVVDLADYDLERLARSTGVLRYEPPINSCALCGMPCSGVMCLSCATK